MLYVAWFVWIAIWGVIGFISFKTIKERIQAKREVDNMVAYWAEKRKLEQAAQQGMYKVLNIETIGEEINLSRKGS